MKKKGYYIRKGKDGSIILNLYKPDFEAFLGDLRDDEGWVKFRIYEREKASENGFTHNMEAIEKVSTLKENN